MQLNCETDELRQMALLMFGEKINALEKRVAELEANGSEKDEQIRGLEQDVKERDEKIDQLQAQIVEMTMRMSGTVMTAWALQQYLILSQQKARIYVSSVDNGVKALLGQFMFHALPDNAPQMQIEYVRKVTQPEAPTPPVKVEVSSPGNQIIQTQTNNFMNEEGEVKNGE